MIRAEQIPDEVVEAVMYCFHTRSSARAAIAAALSAWPKGEFLGDDFCQPRFVLPFPSKEGDA